MTSRLAAVARGASPIGIGTGSLALVFGAIVANRWFVERRGARHRRVLRRQLDRPADLPPAIAAPRRRAGWRWAAASSPCSRCCWCRWCVVLRDHRRRRGDCRTGGRRPLEPPARATAAAARLALTALRGRRAPDFWILVRHVLDLRLVDQRPDRHPLHPGRARPRHARRPAGLLALVGVFDIVGTIASGWLTDRFDTPLAALRLLLLPRAVAAGGAVAARPGVHPSLFVFIVFYGLDWVATVPPTVALCRQHFGIEKRASSSAGSSPPTWWGPASRRAMPAGSARAR